MDTSIKTISLLDSDTKNNQTTDKTISLFDSDTTINLTTNKIPSLLDTTNNQTTDKTISLLDSDTVLNLDSTYTILDTNTIYKNIKVKHQIKIYFRSITELVKIPKNKCIKYIYKHKLNKIIWGILSDIILFDNYTLIILKKGSYTWRHIINFSNYIYFYMS